MNESLSFQTPFFELKNLSKKGEITGYASIFNVLDGQKDIVVKGAFKESLQKWSKQKKYPKMLWNHEVNQPVGIWTKMVEDERGLYVEGQLLFEVKRAEEIHTLLRNQAIDGLSIGYRVTESHYNQTKKVRILTKIDLFEVSFVTFAANPEAQILSVKNNDFADFIDEIERAKTILYKSYLYLN